MKSLYGLSRSLIVYLLVASSENELIQRRQNIGDLINTEIYNCSASKLKCEKYEFPKENSTSFIAQNSYNKVLTLKNNFIDLLYDIFDNLNKKETKSTFIDESDLSKPINDQNHMEIIDSEHINTPSLFSEPQISDKELERKGIFYYKNDFNFAFLGTLLNNVASELNNFNLFELNSDDISSLKIIIITFNHKFLNRAFIQTSMNADHFEDSGRDKKYENSKANTNLTYINRLVTKKSLKSSIYNTDFLEREHMKNLKSSLSTYINEISSIFESGRITQVTNQTYFNYSQQNANSDKKFDQKLNSNYLDSKMKILPIFIVDFSNEHDNTFVSKCQDSYADLFINNLNSRLYQTHFVNQCTPLDYQQKVAQLNSNSIKPNFIVYIESIMESPANRILQDMEIDPTEPDYTKTNSHFRLILSSSILLFVMFCFVILIASTKLILIKPEVIESLNIHDSETPVKPITPKEITIDVPLEYFK